MKSIEVVAERRYPVLIGRALGDEIPPLLEDAHRAAIIHPRVLRKTAEAVRERLDMESILIEIPDAEDAKTAEVLSFCWQALGSAGFTRNDAIIGLGGGATTDLAGFVAATWLRGIRIVQIPTTLLGMVDAAVGGKTGINTSAGKNLVGAFHSPSAVVCDLNTLSSLPKSEIVSGLAEVVKCGFIRDPQILDLIGGNPKDALDTESDVIAELVYRSLAVKAAVVSADLKEAGEREILNYGHTLGHAIELVEKYRWRHGNAVAVGMVFAAELSRLLGRLDSEVVDLHRSLLASLGLPISYGRDCWDELLSAMAIDKKARGTLLRFVVLDSIGKVGIATGPDPAILSAAFAEVRND